MALFFGTPFKYWHLYISAFGPVNLLWQAVRTSSRLWRCGNCTTLECNRRLSLHMYGNEPQEWRWLPRATHWLSWDYGKRVLAPSQVQASFPASNCTGTGTPTICPSQAPFLPKARGMDLRRGEDPHFPSIFHELQPAPGSLHMSCPQQPCEVGIINSIIQRRKWKNGRLN